MHRDFKLFLSVFALTFVLLVGTFTANQGVTALTANSVEIDSIVLSRCGEQSVYASGTATYGPTADRLLVDIDGTHAFNLGTQTSWVTGFALLTPGPHVITARIHNTDGTFTDTNKAFEVPSCEPTPTPTPTPSPTPNPDQGPGDEQDCCPGQNPEPAPNQPTPRVKGISTTIKTASINSLAPINSLFRSVWGHNPTYFQWKYWADRFLTDKPAYDQLLGAMQWQKLHGQVTGK